MEASDRDVSVESWPFVRLPSAFGNHVGEVPGQGSFKWWVSNYGGTCVVASIRGEAPLQRVPVRHLQTAQLTLPPSWTLQERHQY